MRLRLVCISSTGDLYADMVALLELAAEQRLSRSKQRMQRQKEKRLGVDWDCVDTHESSNCSSHSDSISPQRRKNMEKPRCQMLPVKWWKHLLLQSGECTCKSSRSLLPGLPLCEYGSYIISSAASMATRVFKSSWMTWGKNLGESTKLWHERLAWRHRMRHSVLIKSGWLL